MIHKFSYMQLFRKTRFSRNDISKFHRFSVDFGPTFSIFVRMIFCVFPDFLAKIGWVSENCFFFPALFFFCLLNLSVWVGCKLFLGKKKYSTWPNKGRKKKTTKKSGNRQKVLFFTNLHIFLKTDRYSAEWVACKLFLVSATREKKQNKKSPKWVSEYPPNFSAEKKIRYLWVTPVFFSHYIFLTLDILNLKGVMDTGRVTGIRRYFLCHV